MCGLSLGGLVTQQVAIDFPDKVSLAIPMGTSAYIDGFTRDWMQAEIDIRKAGIELPDYFLAPHYAPYAFPAKALHDPDLGRNQTRLHRALRQPRPEGPD